MKRRVSAGEARQRLGELLDGVRLRGDEVVIERAGRTVAVVIPVERYESMRMSRERLFALMEEAQSRNRDVPGEVIEREIDEAVREVRRERRRGTPRRKAG